MNNHQRRMAYQEQNRLHRANWKPELTPRQLRRLNQKKYRDADRFEASAVEIKP